MQHMYAKANPNPTGISHSFTEYTHNDTSTIIIHRQADANRHTHRQ